MSTKRLTINGFLRRLKKARLRWRLTPYGEIRCRNNDCPLIALAYPGGGTTNYQWAGKTLGLNDDDAEMIADVADTPFRVHYMQMPETRLRRRLLQACGISVTHRRA